MRPQLVQKLERTSTEVNEARGANSCSRTRVFVEKEVTRISRVAVCYTLHRERPPAILRDVRRSALGESFPTVRETWRSSLITIKEPRRALFSCVC